jgi:hypothetical protein
MIRPNLAVHVRGVKSHFPIANDWTPDAGPPLSAQPLSNLLRLRGWNLPSHILSWPIHPSRIPES